MIYRIYGEGIIDEGTEKRYYIGASVVCVENDLYKDLKGFITEILTDNDKETDNIGPDIYCTFDKPTDKDAIAELESRFSEAYGTIKTIDDICLDEVIMAPEMIEVVEEV